MFEKSYYTLRELADELNTGESTIRFWQDQFNPWVPCTGKGREKWYPKIAIDILRFIMKNAEEGHGMEEIESRLMHRYPPAEEKREETPPAGAGYFGERFPLPAGLREVLEVIVREQKRLGDAAENAVRQIESISRSLEIIAETLANTPSGTAGSAPIRMTEALPEKQPAEEPAAVEPSPPAIPDDLMELLKDATLETDTEHEPQKETPIEPTGPAAEPPADDLASLLETPGADAAHETDDLAGLIETIGPAAEPQLDDLASLLETPGADAAHETDDLAGLIEPIGPAAEPQLDDLASLLETPGADTAREPDDLAGLIEPVSTETKPLTKAAPETPAPKPPETAAPAPAEKKKLTDIPDDHKSKMIAVIIGMKEKQKLSVSQTVERLNRKGYNPLSGEDHWTHSAVEQIYKHIDIVRTTRERTAAG
ncbi:MAG: MerR family transcriptional regulator [Thermodesulfobacteriota bacterium]